MYYKILFCGYSVKKLNIEKDDNRKHLFIFKIFQKNITLRELLIFECDKLS